MEEDWDYLIILDACRYDYFSRLYREYFVGRLEKAISPASFTVEWCKKSFPKLYDDVVYLSANPYVNSKIEIGGFNAKNRFFKVIDVWDWGWNEKLGTVHPEQVNKAVLNSKDNYPDKRFIIHYLQPHEPYLGYKRFTGGFPRPQLRGGKLNGPQGFQEQSEKYDKMINKILEEGLYLLHELAWALTKGNGPFGGYPSWKIREILNLPPDCPMDSVRRKVGKSGLRQAYAENLRLVLRYAANLVQNLSGEVMITADHGERLGERGRYSHHAGLSDPLLLLVPWFKVEKALATTNCQNAEKKRVKQKIKELIALNKI